MIPILGTGLSGLVGSRVTELLGNKYVFQNLSKETGFDILNYPETRKEIEKTESRWIFHFAAYTDVQGAENEKAAGEKSKSWILNVGATEQIAKACRDFGKKLLYISTDFVFDGEKEPYDEDAIPHPVSWYGMTKFEGEERIRSVCENALIVRIAYPYRAYPVGKMDFVHKIRERLSEGLPVSATSDQTFMPTFIDDIAEGIDTLISQSQSGTFHIVGKNSLSPYEASLRIAEEYGFPKELVTPTTYDLYFASKAKAPKHAVLKHDKIQSLGVVLHAFEEGLQEVKKQETGNI